MITMTAHPLVALYAQLQDVGPVLAERRVQRFASSLFGLHLDDLDEPELDAIGRHIRNGDLTAPADQRLGETLPTFPGDDMAATKTSVLKRKPKVNGTARPHKPVANAPAAQNATASIPGTQKQIPLNQVQPSPLNPRRHFDQAKLAKMADSMKVNGQMQECVVRPKPGGSKTGKAELFELVAGERRYWAATMAKLETLRCRVIEITDAQLAELTGIENYEREDFNAIEEAIWFKSMIDVAGYTQATLAARLKISQPLVSQRLALLDLPEAWKQLIITGVMPASWARDLTPWIRFEAVLNELHKKVTGSSRPHSADGFAHLVTCALRDVSRPMTGESFSQALNRWVSISFKPNAEQLAALDVVKIPARHSGGSAEPRAMNVALWDELQKLEEKRRSEREVKKADKVIQAAQAVGKATSGTRAEKLEAVKRLADMERQKARRVYAYRISWLQRRALDKLKDADDDLLTRLVLHFTIQDRATKRDKQLVKLATSLGGKEVKSKVENFYAPTSGYGTLTSIDPAKRKPEQLMLLLVHAWLKAVDDPFHMHADFGPAEFEALAVELDIDVARDWRMDRAFLDLFTNADLDELAKEWGVAEFGELNAATKRTERINALAHRTNLKAPKRLIQAKAVKR